MEQRAAYRFQTDLEADCRSCNRSWSSRLCNISTTGCMIVCPEELPDRALLRIRLRGLTAIDGKIIWRHRGHAGIRFNAPLHKAVMAHLGFHEPEGIATSAPTPAPAPTPLQPAAAVRRSTPGLHAQLVKRTWQEDRGEKIASFG